MNINTELITAMKDFMMSSSEQKIIAKMKLDTLKMVKTTFMEYVTNKKNAKLFDINDDVNVRVTKIPEDISQKLIEDMISERKNNVEIYKKQNRSELADKEEFEANYLETFIPKAATKEDIEKFISDNYPDGIEQKLFGTVMKQVKTEFKRVDGKLVSEIVKTFIKK